MTSAIAISDYITIKGEGLHTLSIIKLAYISHGYSMALGQGVLFNDRIEAWKYGPMIPTIFYAIRDSYYPTKTYFSQIRLDNKEGIKEEMKLLEKLIPKAHRTIIDRVMEVHRLYNMDQLCNLTSEKGTAWKRQYNPDFLFQELPNNVIKDYYKEILV